MSKDMSASTKSVPFPMLRDTVYTILRDWRRYVGVHSGWSIQGFGMLRLYLSKETRLHVWSHPHKKTSNIHNHPWSFKSVVLSGNILDVVWTRPEDVTAHALREATHKIQTITCGPGGCAHGNVEYAILDCAIRRVIETGDWYTLKHYELHESDPSDGCVTLIHREFQPDTETATVAVPVDQEFEFIEPRPAVYDEVEEIVTNALARWEK